VEGAFVLLVFLMVFFGIFEFCRFLMVRNVAENAAREGARYAAVHTQDKTTTDIQNYVKDYLAGMQGQLKNHLTVSSAFTVSTGSDSDIRVYRADIDGTPSNYDQATGKESTQSFDNWNKADWRNARFGDRIAVQVLGNYQPVTPALLFLPDAILVQVTHTVSSEAN